MSKIADIVSSAFEGHSVAVVKEIHNSGKHLCKMMVGGQSFTMADFVRLRELSEGYDVSFLIENGVLVVIFTRDE